MSGKVTIITGSSRGIGRQLALDCALAGNPVIVNYVSSKAAADQIVQTIADAGGRAFAVRADVSDGVQADHLIAAAIEKFGKLDCVINNAGVGNRIGLSQLDGATFNATLATNLTSAFLVSQAAIQHMKERGGRLIFMSSGAARTGGVISAAYAASKAGLEGLMHYYATYLRSYRITANAIAPSLIATDMIGEMHVHATDQLPLGRLGRPDEIWPAVRMIMETEYLTGQTIHIDAGRYMT
ncbi:SDR family oxidoreductase [Bradyrhizobium yuanmingense]|uniref:SDR family NAD(P)-dependent oxidoreductase n=1 Tax=Bradyrhizobium yuanmingense TaxID=108015 RepID=UPI0023B9A262|nr:SDR family oxidoreductase [Bradyrhizobium yuanmingense]MDF0519096.1 SDR family oxidoreductase [Bradyrhizobium yuanmingense]